MSFQTNKSLRLYSSQESLKADCISVGIMRQGVQRKATSLHFQGERRLSPLKGFEYIQVKIRLKGRKFMGQSKG